MPNLWPKYKGMDRSLVVPSRQAEAWVTLLVPSIWVVFLQEKTWNVISVYSMAKELSSFKLFLYLSGSQDLLVVACRLLVATCRISLPDQGLNPGPLHWGWGISATSAPGEVLRVEFQLGSMGPHAWWASSAPLCRTAVSTPPASWQEGPSHSFRWQRTASPLHTHTLLAGAVVSQPHPGDNMRRKIEGVRVSSKKKNLSIQVSPRIPSTSIRQLYVDSQKRRHTDKNQRIALQITLPCIWTSGLLT